MKKRLLLSLVVLTGIGFQAGQAFAGEVKIAVAANFTDATRDIVKAFEKETGDTVKASFGSTGKLYSQIENGAPFEIFLAADVKRPEKAEKEGFAVDGSRFTYAKGQLGLWSPKEDVFSDGTAYLKAGEFAHISIANPKTAPYGLAAKQVLTKMGLWDSLQGKLVQGDSISQTFQFAATGAADAGFVALSQVKAWTKTKGTLWQIPADSYEPIIQQAVLLKKGADNPTAKAFIDYLKGDTAHKIILGYGYAVE